MTFHWYGFIIGLAVIIGFLVSENKAKKQGVSEEFFLQVSLFVLLGGILGARVWHIITDFSLYQNDLLRMAFIWEGGLSILGAFLGGSLGLFVFLFLQKKWAFLGVLLDSIAFGLAPAQALGRIANYVNRELYGLPTELPWKIFIPFDSRVTGFEKFSFFHPLFAYELILVLIGWFFLRYCEEKKYWKKGSGKFFVFYLAYYGVIRFFLDFIRIDTHSFYGGLGVNQWSIIFFEFLFVFWWVRHKEAQ